MEKISVIIPLYNAEKYIVKCVESILRQSYENYELIIVNDGSTDDSSAQVKAIHDSRIVYLEKENGGVASARNMGLDYADGDYCVFIDADDELNTDTYLEDLLRQSSFDYVVGGLTHCYYVNGVEQGRNDVCLSEQEGALLHEMPSDFFVKGFVHTCCGKLFKRSIIEEQHLRFEHVRLSEDSLFNAGYLKHIKSWKITDHAGYSYIHRRNGENATAKFYSSDIDVYIELHQRLKDLSVNRQVIHKTMYPQFLAICLRAIKNKGTTSERRKSDLKYILRKPYVRITLLTTVTTLGEWITGVVVCTGSLWLYSIWDRFVKTRRK